MSNLFQVDVEPELISEFREELEAALQNAETCIITLENDPSDIDALHTTREIFNNLSISSTKLSLIPLSESLNDTLKIFDKLFEWQQFPPRMGEFLLLLTDRIIYLAKEVERNLVIDMRETQNILVSLQQILRLKDSADIETAIESAIDAITKNINENTVATDSEFVVELFDDDSEQTKASEITKEEPGSIPDVEIFIPKQSINPMLLAKDIITSMKQDESISLLAEIADQSTSFGDSHTQFLLELCLGVNHLAGDPIDVESLAKGICLHDIALSAVPHILNKPGKLTAEELDVIRQHPLKGVSLAQAMKVSEDTINVIAHHHERIDGSGYPMQLKNDQISDAGKVSAIVDSFHAMIDDRPHKKYNRSNLRAIAEINACVDSHYDKFWIKQFNVFMKQYWLPAQKQRK